LAQRGTGPVATVVICLAVALVDTSIAFAPLGNTPTIAVSAHKPWIFKLLAPSSPAPRKQLSVSITNINLVESGKSVEQGQTLFEAAQEDFGR
jgi:hypothetical protein